MGKRVFLGEPPFALSNYGGDVASLIEGALSTGYRWLTFSIGGWCMNRGVNLDAYASGGFNSVVFEGPGPYLAQVNRCFNPDTGSLFFTQTTAWDVHFVGMTFADHHSFRPADPKPLVWLRNVGNSYFKNCVFVGTGASPGNDGFSGDGLHLGPDQAAILAMIAPRAMDNGINGIFIDNGICVAAFGAMGERNDQTGGAGGAQFRLSGQVYSAHGGGVFLGSHVEAPRPAGGATARAFAVTRWRALRIAAGEVIDGAMECASDATNEVLEGFASTALPRGAPHRAL